MKILKDSIFKIGKAHSVCQDYASNKENIIALSDGCSSSLDTDIGARFLVKDSIKDIFSIQKFSQADACYLISGTLRALAASYLDVNPLTCLDATLLCGKIIKNERLISCIYGDGVFSYQLKNDTIKIIQVVFANNAPYYLSYLLSTVRQNNYLEIFGGQKTISEYTIQNGKIINTEIKVVKYNECCEYEFNVDDLKSFFLFSDGVETFHQVIKTETSKFTKDIPTVDSVLEIMNCPTFGPFLEKKYTKLSEQYVKQGIFHSDDLSVAAFLFQEDL